MDLPIRKPTRLKNFDYSSNGMYFITICTKNKEHLFGSIVGDGVLDVPHNNYQLLTPDNVSINLSETGQIVKKHILLMNQLDNITVDKYVIMPNHIHLIIYINKPFVSDYTSAKTCGTSRTPSPTNAIIPRTISGFKRLINKEVCSDIFQRSYHDHIIRNEMDYEKIWEYIDTNPLRWEDDCFYNN